MAKNLLQSENIEVYEGSLRALLRMSLDAVFISIDDGSILEANSAACRIFGYSEKEFKELGRGLIVDETDPRLWELLAKRITEGAAISALRLKKKDGTVIDAELSAMVVPRSGGGHYALTVIRDVTERVQSQRLIQESEERRYFALDAARIGDWDMDLRTNVATRSLRHDQCFGYQSAVAHWGYDTFLAHVHPEDRDFVDRNFQQALLGAGAYDVEFRVIWPNQTVHWLWSRGRFYFDANGKPIRVSGIQVEITDRYLAEQAMRLNTRALESASNGIVICDALSPGMPLLYVNPAFEKITGYSSSEALGANFVELNRGIGADSTLASIRSAIADGRDFKIEVLNHRKDGRARWSELQLAPVRDRDGKVSHVVGIETDISERKRQEDILFFRANHDELTGLPNRHCLTEALDQLIRKSALYQERIAVLYIDLDRFKRFNDTMGHGAGDQILRRVAASLDGARRGIDTLGRFGGDEFLLLCPGIGRSDIEALVNRIFQQLRSTRPHGEETLLLPTASIGISLFPEDGHTGEDLLKKADLAMYAAKFAGRDRYRLFFADMADVAQSEHTVEQQLRKALLHREIEVYYQPQIDLGTGALAGVEALARWTHPTLGRIAPSEFIRIAENSGLIGILGEHILRCASSQNAEWIRAGLCDVPIAVNVSSLQFREANFVEMVHAILCETQLPTNRLEIELTESILMEGTEISIGTMQSLRDAGIHISVDDFGTGYSSLSYLRYLPVSRLKIDQSFIRDLLDNRDAVAIATAIVNLGHSLGFKVIAEGVETEFHASLLRQMGCDFAQGYFFSAPVSAEVFTSSLSGR